MKTISSIKELTELEPDLAKFIMYSCPWITEDWNAEEFGFIFLLDDTDTHKITSICTVLCIPESNNNYRDLMTIDLTTFDLWETPAYQDPTTGYWNVVAILGQEYGCALFMSSGFVKSIPALHERLSGNERPSQKIE